MLRNRFYYSVKPFVPEPLRRIVRRRFAARLRKHVGEIWPIMPGSERLPEGWPGWPDEKKFAVVLTHDVEGEAGLQKCRALMQLEIDLGFRSSFNFIPEGDYRVSKKLREELVANGFEVGIHDLKHDGRLFTSRHAFTQRAARINRYAHEWGAAGFRSGFMLHKLDWLHDLEVQYDASTFDTDPFEPQPEGRHTIFPFWVPRPSDASANGQVPALNSSSTGYVELPYTLPQDSTLFLLLKERTIDIWLRKLDWIARNGGMVLVDTHPDYMSPMGARPKAAEYPIEFYERLLQYIRSEYAGLYWTALPRQVASYVRDTRRIAVASEHEARSAPASDIGIRSEQSRLRNKRGAVLLFSHYPADPRPRRAAEALVQEGASIELICLQDGRDEPSHEVINGVRVHRVPLRRRRGGQLRYVGQYTAFILTAFVRLAVRSIKQRYDFVHVHNMPDALVFSALVPRLLGAKVILDLHDPMPELMQTIFGLPENGLTIRLLKRLEKWSIRFAHSVITVNRACKQIYSSRSCPPEKIHVVLNSPEDNIFVLRPPALPPANGHDSARPFTVLYHGSLVERNGFDLAVDALEITRRAMPKARLMVCGVRTPFFETVMKSARQRGLADAIDYAGVKDRQQIVEAILHCNLGIIPNHRNVFTEINTPTRIFEYLALGKPVIAPDAAGIKDYFSDRDLIFFELGDANDLANKIEFAFRNPGKVEEIVGRGQQVYLGHTWSRERLQLLKAINELF